MGGAEGLGVPLAAELGERVEFADGVRESCEVMLEDSVGKPVGVAWSDARELALPGEFVGVAGSNVPEGVEEGCCEGGEEKEPPELELPPICETVGKEEDKALALPPPPLLPEEEGVPALLREAAGEEVWD